MVLHVVVAAKKLISKENYSDATVMARLFLLQTNSSASYNLAVL